MKSCEFQKSKISQGLLVAGLITLSQQSFAQEDRVLEEVITIGTRVEGRTATQAAVPIDIIQSEDLAKGGFTELGQSLQSLAPSFNFSRTQISDGGDLFRPATLRGLQPDQTLVLINGKRRHSQAIFQPANTVGGGASGTDMNSIPLTALRAVEVLRDGAAAQYGSDAIAGVINLQLKNTTDETTGFLQYGEMGEGDGETVTAGINTGFDLGSEGGFINLSLEYRDFEETDRARPGWFQGDAGGDFSTFFYNAALPIGDGGELYSFGGYSERSALGSGFRRQGDSATQNVPQVYPDGFLPNIENDAEDLSFAIGYRREFSDEWDMDVSYVYGENEYEFGSANTINASIAGEYLQNNPGASDEDIAANAGPTSGFSAGRGFEQSTFNLDVNGSFDIGGEPLYVAVGAEYRDENATSKAGVPASYSCGSQLSATIPSVIDPAQSAECGFQAFPGVSPDTEVDADRDSFALYVDLERNLTDSWLLGVAVRYEDFSDAGDETVGKISTRYDFTDNFALRGAFSTGFRAPALQQTSFQAFQTNLNDAGDLERSYTAESGSAFPVALGVDGLDIETSQSLSLGMVWSPTDSLTITLDGYQVEIEDRIVLGGLVNRDAVADNPEALAVLVDLGVNGASFFSNAVNTTTEGVDLIATYATELGGGSLDITLAANYNKTTIDSFNVPEGSTEDQIYPSEIRSFLTHGQPRERGNLSFNWANEKWSSLLRVNYFGETEVDFFGQNHIGLPDFLSPTGEWEDTSVVDSNVLVDIYVSYLVTDNITLAVGGNNIFDEVPDKVGEDEVLDFIAGGFNYPIRAVPYGFNGSSYYLKMAFAF
jgi:iron complex outermembrane receptor protein